MESLLTPYNASLVLSVASVLVLAPHPDDEVFGCGGSLALHVLAGTQVHVVVCTSGEVAGRASVREDESRQAARILGYAEPVFWGMTDRGVAYSEAFVERIGHTLKAIGASILYAPSLWENHPDHRAVALAAREAVRRSDHCDLMYYEVGAPLRPNLLVDITLVREQKRAAMTCFASQLSLQRYGEQIEALNIFRSYTLPANIVAAEAFESYDARSLRSLQSTFFSSEYRRQQVQGLMELPADMLLVSVLIRSMDRPDLDRALDSVAIQTWPRVEVVVVNAKGPGHRALPAWCGRFPMRLIDSDEPLHRSAAANLAMDCANGSALLLLDDDDWLDADHLHKLATALHARPDAIAAVTGARAVDIDGICVHEWHEPTVQRLLLGNQMPIMSVLFRKNTTASAPRFDSLLDLFEDWDFWLQIRMQGEFVNVSGISATYMIRLVGGSGVHEVETSRRGQVQMRNKWRMHWPDAWLEALRVELDNGTDQIQNLRTELTELQRKTDLLQANLNAVEYTRAALDTALTEHTRAHMLTVETFHTDMEYSRQQCADVQVKLTNQIKESRLHNDRSAHLIAEQSQLILHLQAQQIQQSEAERIAHLSELQLRTEMGSDLVSVKKQRNSVTYELLRSRQNLHAQFQALALSQQMETDFVFRLKAMVESRSWRITAPLRFMGEKIRELYRHVS